MADVIRKATNKFTKGLVMDFSPENTRNEVLTQALNATLLTFNGNELSLQNDMGNARVETAYLPDGYMPVGTCEYGGIIYIVSYNPLEDKSLIGCFPSPERNISSEELGIADQKIYRKYFQDFDANGNPDISGLIKHNTLYVLLKNDKLNPGDKFIVCAEKDIYNERLADLWVDKNSDDNSKTFELVSNPIIALNVVSIEDSGKIVYLNSDIRLYEVSNNYTLDGNPLLDTYKYHILGKMISGTSQLAKDDLDSYRNVLSSGYSVFKSKTSGKLAILAELIMIDSYSVTHEIKPRKDEEDNIVEGTFDIILHTDVSPEITEENYNIVPKLLYYYLENSQGYIQIGNLSKGSVNFPLFNDSGEYDEDFFRINLKDIYEPIDESFKELIDPPSNSTKTSPTLGQTGKFNFPKPYTYHGRSEEYTGDLTGTTDKAVYTKFTEGKYHRIDYSQITENSNYTTEELLKYYTKNILAKFYYYDANGEDYLEYEEEEIDDSYTYYIRKPDHIYHDALRDESNRNKELYKLITLPLVATSKEINDNTIEKFLYQDIHFYRVATEEELASGSQKLYYKEDDGQTYVQLTGKVEDNVTYYVFDVESNLVSIGYDVNYNVVTGTVYYYPTTKTFEVASAEDIEKYYDFQTYPYLSEAPYGSPITLYWKEENYKYIPATENQITNREELNITLFYSTNYKSVSDISLYRKENLLFIVVPMDAFISADIFLPSTEFNYINGKDKPVGQDEPADGYPKDDPLYLFTISDFIPDNLDQTGGNYLKYNEINLANIKIPGIVSTNGLDLPFKYDYTLVPCMNYGKLQHLAVSNTIDFSKLHAFNQSDFTTWKYYIYDNQLRLTFGADVYDTYEEFKVDGLILEFYDCWGFAGSIEIVDKKSYSGIFTKIIPLNSLRAISRKKILVNGQKEDYVRNINIKEARDADGNIISNSYTFNGNTFVATDIHHLTGWQGYLGFDANDEQNDCGTLYSNLVYGVKAYLRRDVEGTKEFIHKKDFFLYTLPIYNDFYYTLNDFSNLTYPLLDLMLTYKLKDNSTKTVYSQGTDIIDGYVKTDKDSVNNYLDGNCETSSLNVIKYYKYSGYSDLYLEIGLKKDYEDLNLSYDPDINKYFSCALKLLSDDSASATFTVNSGIEGLVGTKQVLNYPNDDIIDTESNKLLFEGDKNEITISGDDFIKTNFINNIGDSPIKINYNFVVGYTANINDIRTTLVQATTVCALCHKTATGEYNYEDFGVYEQTSTNADGSITTQLLSSIMFYNEGTSESEIFGTCRQISTTGNILELCGELNPVETQAQEIKIQGKLNSGEPLKQLVGSIGKLSFCLPHAHGLSDKNGVNIYLTNSGTYLGISPEYGNWRTRDLSDLFHDDDYDDTYGIVPTQYLFNNPRYNISLNTKNSINYNSEFISTLDFKETSGKIIGYDFGDQNSIVWSDYIPMREYTGFTGSEISTFNLKMIETMKSIYAYNPDYDSLTVSIGNITLQNYNPYFTSNLLSYNAQITFNEPNTDNPVYQTLNDFIYLGPIKFYNYLQYLKKNSLSIDETFIEVTEKDKSDFEHFLPQVLLIPGYDYCGNEENYYLISPLTYNTPIPSELEAELEYSSSNIIVIKHSDGTNSFLEGVPNKKILYGYNADFNKMVLLDVSNYTIDSNGVLKLKNEGSKETISLSLDTTDNSEEINSNLYHGSHLFNCSYNSTNGETVNLQMMLGLYMDGNNFRSLTYGKEGIFVGDTYNLSYDSGGFTFKTSLKIINANNKSDYTYSVKLDSIEFSCSAKLLNDYISLNDYPIALYNQTYENLAILTSTEELDAPLIDTSGNLVTPEQKNSYYWARTETGGFYTYVYANNQLLDLSFVNTIALDSEGIIEFKFGDMFSMNTYSLLTELFEFKLKKVNFTITQVSKLESSTDLFIHTTRTAKYANKVNHKYVVLDEYKQARLRGSSITINDLLYEPSVDGHRLFMRNNLCTYDPYLRNKIYYRFLNILENNLTGHNSWKYEETKYLNNIFMFTGPCFTEDNLE